MENLYFCFDTAQQPPSFVFWAVCPSGIYFQETAFTDLFPIGVALEPIGVKAKKT